MGRTFNCVPKLAITVSAGTAAWGCFIVRRVGDMPHRRHELQRAAILDARQPLHSADTCRAWAPALGSPPSCPGVVVKRPATGAGGTLTLPELTSKGYRKVTDAQAEEAWTFW